MVWECKKNAESPMDTNKYQKMKRLDHDNDQIESCDIKKIICTKLYYKIILYNKIICT